MMKQRDIENMHEEHKHIHALEMEDKVHHVLC